MAVGKVNLGNGGIKITGQGEVAVNYYEDINKGDLVTVRKHFGFERPLKLPNPSTLPPDRTAVVAISDDDTYFAVGIQNSTTPAGYIYKRDGDTFTPVFTFPEAYVTGLSFSPSADYFALFNNGPDWRIYKRDGDTFTQILLLPNSPQNGRVEFSPSSGNYLARTSPVSPFFAWHKRDGDSFSTLANPSPTPPGASTDLTWSPDETYLAVSHRYSPFVTIYKRDGDTLTKLPNPDVLPSEYGKSVAFSGDGNYLAVGHDNYPFLTIYKRDGDTFTKIANPDVLPDGSVQACDFSSDSNFLSVATLNSPYLLSYKRNGDIFTKTTGVDVAPTGSVYSIKYGNMHSYLMTSCFVSPFVFFYKADILVDYAYKYLSLSDIHVSNYVAFGYAKQNGLTNDIDKKIVTLPIK